MDWTIRRIPENSFFTLEIDSHFTGFVGGQPRERYREEIRTTVAVEVEEVCGNDAAVVVDLAQLEGSFRGSHGQSGECPERRERD